MHPNHNFYRFNSAKGKIAMREKKAQGELMHLAPLGFLNARDALGRSIMVPDPKTYRLMLEAAALREQGYSIRCICKALNRKGLRSKRGNQVSPQAMWHALEHLGTKSA